MIKHFDYLIKRYELYNQRVGVVLKKLANLRLISFLLLILSMFASIQIQWFTLLALVSLISFVIWVKRYQFYEKKRSFYLAKKNYTQMNKDRLTGDWNKFDFTSKKLNFKSSHISLDMDVFGKNSLYQHLWLNATTAGDQRLADRLASLKPADELTDIQDAVQELKSKEYLRSTILAIIHSTQLDKFDSKRITTWLKKTIQLSKIDLILAWSPVVMILLFIASAFLPILSIAIAYLFIQFAVVLLRQNNWFEFYTDILEKNQIFFAYKQLMELIAKQEFSSKKLSDIHQQFSQENKTVSDAFTTFQKLINKLSLRYSDIAHNTMNSLFMWDIWTIKKLKTWQDTYQERIPLWFDSLTEFEFLLSLSNFYRLNPDYTFPKLNATKIEFKQIGHPLLPRATKVCNDFEIEAGQIAIITGSNMAGKTTFLRTVAVNLVLAYVGAPVSATLFSSPIFVLESSIKITDSLSDGVSFFYAEVKRLKEILTTLNNQKNVIFFIDEMLKGTNNRERYLASDNLIRQMLQTSGIGLFSTHDLELIKLANEFKTQVINYHFSEDAGSDSLSFDYKLKTGPVKSTNAIKILKSEGLYNEGLAKVIS